MMVRMSADASAREGLTAIRGYEERHTQNVNPLIVVRIDANLAVIEWPRATVVELLPGLALVFRAEDAAGFDVIAGFRRLPGHGNGGLVGLHHRVHDVWILAINRETAAAQGPIR